MNSEHVILKYIGNTRSSMEHNKRKQFLISIPTEEYETCRQCPQTKRTMRGKIFDAKNRRDMSPNEEREFVNPFYEMRHYGFPVFVRVEGDEMNT